MDLVREVGLVHGDSITCASGFQLQTHFRIVRCLWFEEADRRRYEECSKAGRINFVQRSGAKAIAVFSVNRAGATELMARADLVSR